MFSSFSNSASLSQYHKPPVAEGPFIGLLNGLLDAQNISVEGNYINAPFTNWD